MSNFYSISLTEAREMIFELYRDILVAGTIETQERITLGSDESIARNALARADTAIVEYVEAAGIKVVDDLTGIEWSGPYFLIHAR